MKYKILRIVHNQHQDEDDTILVEVALDDELTKLLGRIDASCYTGSLSYIFHRNTSDAVVASAVRNDIARRKFVALASSRLSHLVGKEFEV